MCYISNICSLCLVPNQSLKNILSTDIDGTVVQDKLKVFLLELINFQQNTPKYICMNCLMVVNYIHNFRLRCLENIATLQRYLIRPEVSDPYETKYSKYTTNYQDQNSSIAYVTENNTQSNEYVNTNFMNEGPQKNEPKEIDPIKVEENTCVQPKNENTVFLTPYETFEQFNEEKYIDENVNNLSNIHNIPDNNAKPELLVSTNIKVEDVSETESFEENESDEEYLPSDSCSTDNEENNSTNSVITQAKDSNVTIQRTDENVYNKANLSYKQSNQKKSDNNESIDRLFKPHKCAHCPKSYAYKCKLTIHERKHTGIRPFKCDLCEKTFTENGALTVHKKKHSGVKPFVCDICGKAFALNNFLLKHKQTHSKIKPHKCEICHKSFTRLDYLLEHKRSHVGLKPFQCELCNKSFNRLSNLTEHKRIHTGEKPFQCEVCHKSFCQKSNLRKHQRIHSGIKAHQCDICLKTFTEASSVKTHKRRHSGDKPFECSFCSKKFLQLGHLLRHKLLHSGDKPFPCEVCPYRSRNKTHLKHHMLRRHNKVDENIQE